MLKFANTLYIVPRTIKVGEAGVPLEWHVEEGFTSEIEYIQPGCGCTAEVKIEDGRVLATYNDNTRREEVAEMPGQVKTISKNLRVFLKDGKPLMVKNERGVETYNQQKQSMTLFFHVNVSV